jgi:hydrogenase maturation protein HypF
MLPVPGGLRYSRARAEHVERLLIEVRGTVQGVGFRPHVYSLATSLGLSGFVQNRGGHLFIDLEGESSDLQTFMTALGTTFPARAAIDDISCRPATPRFRTRFSIDASDPVGDVDVRVSPDIATCDACLDELFNPRNRRYRYPFITCAQCGPRFTIVTGVPYDRLRTTMSGFAMCETCRREYENPSDRRFHAESIACADCGPTLELHECDGAVLRGSAVIEGAVAALCQGRIVALKGLGGYHLACDAGNGDAVAMLRTRKHRDAKPFAIMVTPSDARHLQHWEGLWAALNGPERPIVLVDRAFLRAEISNNVAPGCPTIGIMRPYTPLHHLLMRGVSRPLVMTSGNVSDEPIAFEDEDARHRLSRIADAFITHDRPIHTRCDDSVVRLIANDASPIRRARGLAPASLTLIEQALEPILATGGHLKNTFCLHAGSRAWISSHVGDLSSAAAYAALREGVRLTTSFLDRHPAIVAHDLHPDYLSTRFAEEYPAHRRVGVQHHHAHVLSCAAEHRVTEPVLGVAFDGSGLGTDGAVWGGEFLLAEGSGFTRLAHLASVPLAGGDAAVREPWRMAVAHLTAAGHGAMLDAIADRIGPARFATIRQMIVRGTGAPLTSSVGRLFDAIASIAGVRDHAVFEGQAAMELEAFADRVTGRPYAFDVTTSADPWIIDASPVISAVADDVLSGVDSAAIAAGFHDALARIIADVAERLAARAGVHYVALTGGVFQNALLTNAAAAALERAGVTALVHRQVPCNDGGLSLGQAVAAARILHYESSQRERPACV